MRKVLLNREKRHIAFLLKDEVYKCVRKIMIEKGFTWEEVIIEYITLIKGE